MATGNEIWLNTGKQLERLDLVEDTQLLPTFQANDRTKPDTIQSIFSAEFEAPQTAKNSRLLSHAASNQTVAGQPYKSLRAVLTSGGVEALPNALLYIKGYKDGKYQLQIFGGNINFVRALGDKKLADLDFSNYNHYWTPENILARLPYAYWEQHGYGYEVYDRGKPLDLQNVDPYTLYPSVSGQLLLSQILAEAGFIADDLLSEPLFRQLNVPSANPYQFGQDFRDARQLTAGYFYQSDPEQRFFYHHDRGFVQERLNFAYTERKPYHLPAVGTATYFGGLFKPDTLGYYDIEASVVAFFGCNSSAVGGGKVRLKVMLLVNGQHLFDVAGNELGKDEEEKKGYGYRTFSPKLSRYLLHPGDTVELVWRGDDIDGPAGSSPDQARWAIGPYGATVLLPNAGGLVLSAENRFSVTMLAEFPPGGLVRLQDWLPDMKQLDFVKSYLLLGGLTIQADAYEPHLRLSTG